MNFPIMTPLRCLLGFHQGDVVPAYEVQEEIDGLSAFKCRRCGAVIEHT